MLSDGHSGVVVPRGSGAGIDWFLCLDGGLARRGGERGCERECGWGGGRVGERGDDRGGGRGGRRGNGGREVLGMLGLVEFHLLARTRVLALVLLDFPEQTEVRKERLALERQKRRGGDVAFVEPGFDLSIPRQMSFIGGLITF